MATRSRYDRLGVTMNNLTKYLTFGVDFLFLKHPTRTSLGFILGVAFKPALKFLAVFIASLQAVLLASISVWEYGLIGLALFHIPTAVSLLMGKTRYLSENEEKAFKMIRELNIPDFEKQVMYLKIVEKVLERVELKPEIQNEIKNQAS